ncbi:MAG: DALR anticodon-binding domain-containing protein [Xenococcaceae cyanobacterium]
MEDNDFCQKYVRLSWQFPDNSLSVRELIVNFLEDYIDRLLLKKTIENIDFLKVKTSIAKIKIHRLRDNSNIIYRCAIAYQLAPILSLSPLEVARQIIEFATTIESDFSEKDRQILAIEISPSGWIDFCLDELFLANWLQKFEQVQGTAFTPYSLVPIPFPIQYAHARCCSLLKLGERVKLIELKDREFRQAVWQIQHPLSLPWLNEKGNFQLLDAAEICLIENLLAAVDAISNRQENEMLKFTLLLGEAFLNFWDSCRIFGDAIANMPQLATARLGLIAATQLVLKVLIENSSDTCALVEL